LRRKLEFEPSDDGGMSAMKVDLGQVSKRTKAFDGDRLQPHR
jgi:hypothetical protein